MHTGLLYWRNVSMANYMLIREHEVIDIVIYKSCLQYEIFSSNTLINKVDERYMATK